MIPLTRKLELHTSHAGHAEQCHTDRRFVRCCTGVGTHALRCVASLRFASLPSMDYRRASRGR